jgi:hypothetical protein
LPHRCPRPDGGCGLRRIWVNLSGCRRHLSTRS